MFSIQLVIANNSRFVPHHFNVSLPSLRITVQQTMNQRRWLIKTIALMVIILNEMHYHVWKYNAPTSSHNFPFDDWGITKSILHDNELK